MSGSFLWKDENVRFLMTLLDLSGMMEQSLHTDNVLGRFPVVLGITRGARTDA